jgi:alpha-glucoside transport system permease protein
MSSLEAIAATESTTAQERPAQPVKAVRKTFSSPIATVLVLVMTIMWTIPTFGLLVTSVRPAQDVATTGWWTFFVNPHFTLSNYETVLFQNTFGASSGLMPFLINSAAITIPATIIPLVLAAMAAYVLAWVRFRGSDTIFFIIFALQVVPLQMALIPLLSLFSGGLHLGDVTVIPALKTIVLGVGPVSTQLPQYTAVWTAHTMFALPLAIFLLHNFIAQLPKDVMEAAMVDGANHFRVFRSIVLPLATPALASFAIFQFLWVWNDLLVGLTFAGTPDVVPLTVRLAQLGGNFGRSWELLTAGAFVSIVVPLIVFFALQRYFVRGLLAGSVKG